MKYNQFNDTRLFLPDNETLTVSSGWYFSANNSEPLPASVDLEESWNKYLGYYFFLTNPIDLTDTNALNDLASAFTEDETLQNPKHTGAVWLANAIKPLGIPARIETDKNEERPVISGNRNLGFGAYRFPVFDGAPVSIDIANAELQVGYPGIEGAQEASMSQGARISVGGPLAGVIRGEAMINDFSSDPFTGWSVGFRYNMSNQGVLQTQFYTFFEIAPTRYFLFDLLWDPLHPLDASRTQLTFTGFSFRLEKVDESSDRFQMLPQEEPNLLKSYWRTLYGKEISLRPVLSGERKAQLVFQTHANPESNDPAYYLAPSGDFELCIPGEGGKQFEMLCGLAGTECLLFTAGDGDKKGDILTFTPGKGAYTKYYPVVNGAGSNGMAFALRSEPSEILLDETYTASWAAIRPAEGNPTVTYFVAPEAASLYRPGDTGGVLNAFYAQAAQFSAAAFAEENICFPMVPYSGVEHQRQAAFNPDDIKPFELQIIGAARKQVIAGLSLPPDEILTDAPVVQTTTPQGLLATIQGSSWKEVLLAHNMESGRDFAFIDLPAVLRNAFQTNELFLVASDAGNLGNFQNSITIEGWTFNVKVPTRNPDQDPQQNNILLLKFRKGSILELVQDVNSWTDAAGFNYNKDQVVSTQTWLIQYCNDAIAMAEKNERYAHFSSLIQDPNWYGILSLKVNVDLGAFPKDLKGLLGAMDLSRFDAHHIGVQVNYVQPTEGDQTGISIKKSNLFALISYIDPSYAQSQNISGGTNGLSVQAVTGGDALDQVTYAYKVLTLQIVFANSAISNFESKLQLTARKWFNEDASLNQPKGDHSIEDDPTAEEPANYAMLFNGHYENHEGHKTYTFLTEKGAFYQYFITSKVLNYVEFIKAQFSTLSAIKESPQSVVENVNSVFTFYGYLNFLPQEHFDLFSYGSEKGNELAKGKGLYFSNMAVNVNFKLDTEKSKTSDLTLLFSPGQMAFDQTLSTIRKASLGKGFPLSPTAILSGKGDNLPAKTGYLHVVPPSAYISGTLGTEWFGLNMELHWGGPGALANQAGFTPNLLLAWSPGSTLSTEILIRLPGDSSGGKTLSLQNVLKLKVGTFRFDVVEHGEDQISYNLILTSIALSLMGLKFPPVGNTNLMLLGDPSQPGSMGWYGAYINK